MELKSLPPHRLLYFIDRVRKFEHEQQEHYLHTLLRNVLTELIDFVPSEAIAVLLDDPIKKRVSPKDGELTYVSVLGDSFTHLLGKSLHSTSGILGETYTLCKPMVRKAGPKERLLLEKTNTKTEFDSALAIPLKIEEAVVGVFAVIDKKDPIGFTLRDLKLVEIFAGYISTALQNVLDAKRSIELSKRDDLTGLYNDRYFHHQLQKELELAQQRNTDLSLVFLDLDYFKQINDQHGHLVGSATLKEVGLIIRECVPFESATLARYGGDEYVMILPTINAEKASEVAEHLRKSIFQKLFMISLGETDGSFVSFKGLISASIGVASLRQHVKKNLSTREKKTALLKLADAAMYKSKELGKNCVTVAEPAL